MKIKITLITVLLLLWSFKAFAWIAVPGTASDVANGWITGTNPVYGGYGIFRWDGSKWIQMPGGALRIGGSYNNPWVINIFQQIFRWDGLKWIQLPGTAQDVADGWVVGTDKASNGDGNHIYRWNGASWTPMPGAAVSIGGTYSSPWITDMKQRVFRWDGSAWQLTSGLIGAFDVGDGWIVSNKGLNSDGFDIYRWNGLGWTQVPGKAIHVGGTSVSPWVTNLIAKQIFRLNAYSPSPIVTNPPISMQLK